MTVVTTPFLQLLEKLIEANYRAAYSFADGIPPRMVFKVLYRHTVEEEMGLIQGFSDADIAKVLCLEDAAWGHLTKSLGTEPCFDPVTFSRSNIVKQLS